MTVHQECTNHSGGCFTAGKCLFDCRHLGREWKLGNEYLPFHPQASHVNPDYRDGWNAAMKATPSTAQLWQHMNTAPKDGTYILVSNGIGTWVAHWAPVAVSGYRFDQPWRSVMLNHDHIEESSRYLPPTRWMPLPA